MNDTALVVGAGVSGLTTAVTMAEAGYKVTVWTAEPPELTTSAAAGAMWGPYLTEPRGLIQQLSLRSLDVLTDLAADPATGVALVRGIEAGRTPVDPPDWADLLPDFKLCTRPELPAGFVSGWRFTAPIIDMLVYLSYLRTRLEQSDGSIEIHKINTLAEATESSALVINCTGYGAGAAVPDPAVTAVRGDLIVVDQPPIRIHEFFSEETGLSPDLVHIYPQRSHVILGGTAVPDVDTREPDDAIANAILDRCAAVEPRLKDAAIREHRVGLRPTRPKLRLEVDTDADYRSKIIHNYGHGGSGVTLSWGCSERVLELTQNL
ncbi:FAD-dependent oxidoreductase [Microlunatus parietis]|uniref:D-amino-acid oxidase n=1 Tax=Microlunatus parietis TaxID=682979 RepID=A0A7Y9LAG5_9ACTN|nr:FAD-dependent oxidoreductase [Microlunatus parietis]NYE70667.1 D-amino-acid oxidase [Microlunatus parietis]